MKMNFGWLCAGFLVGISVLSGRSAAADVVLPDGYTQVEWIQSTGTQWIDTGVLGKSTVNVALDMQWVSGNNLFGERSSTSAKDRFGFWGANTWVAVNYGGLDSGQKNSSDMSARVVVSNDNCELFANGSSLYTAARQQFASSIPLAIFTVRKSVNPATTEACSQYRLYGLKIWDDGVLVRDFVPCHSKNGELGVFDLVEGRFRGNNGTGTFLAGSSGYPEMVFCDYIQSSGTQWIDTEVIGKSTVNMALDMQWLGGGNAIFGERTSTSASDRFGFWGTDSWVAINYGAVDSTAKNSSDMSSRVVVSNDNCALFTNGNSLYTANRQQFVSTLPLAVFTVRKSLSPATTESCSTCRVYGLKLWDDGVLVHDSRPAVKADGTCGLYDFCTGKFLGNSGTGEFIYGSDFWYAGSDQTMRAYNGSMKSKVLEGYSAVEKVGAGLVVLDLDAVNLPFTFRAGSLRIVRPVAFTQSVKLEGGTRLVYDDGSALSINAIDLTDVTAEHPVTIDPKFVGQGSSFDAPQILISDARLQLGDLNKFTLADGIEASVELQIQDGYLMLAPIGSSTEVVLPEGYVRLAYVESTGTQWTDTGVLGKSTVNMALDMQWLGGGNAIFGEREFTLAPDRFGFWGADIWVAINYGAADSKQKNSSDMSSRVVVSNDNCALFTNGNLLYTTDQQQFSSTLPLAVCAVRNNLNPATTETPSKCRVYGLKIWNDGVLVRDFMPALNTVTHQIGFYDLVEGVFYGSASGTAYVGAYPAEQRGFSYTKSGDYRKVVNGVNLVGELTLEGGSLEVAETASEIIRCNSLNLAGGTLAFTTLGVGTPEIQVAGAARVTGTVVVTVPPSLATGTYNLVSAESFTVNGGAVTLANGCARGADGATRTLQQTATGLQLVVGAQQLPAGYTRLAGISSSGTQWINTETEVWELSSIDLRFSNSVYVHGTAFFGQDEWTGNRCLLNQQSDLLYFHGNSVQMGSVPSSDQNCRVVVGADNFVHVTQGEATNSWAAYNEFSGIDRTLNLFAIKGGACAAAYTLEGCRIATDGTLVRDFVPCRNPQGEVGLWDFVEGKFFANQGTGKFVDAGTDVSARLDYIEPTAAQFVDTLYTHTATTKIVCRANVATDQPYTTWTFTCLFGSRNGDRTKNAFAFYSHTNKNGSSFNRSGVEDIGPFIPFDTDVTLTCLGRQAYWPIADGTMNFINATGTVDAGVNSMYIFAVNSAVPGGLGTPGGNSKMKLYSFEIYDNDVLLHQFIPWRDAAGRVGLYDNIGRKFHPNGAMGVFDYGYAYNTTADGVTVYDGAVTDPMALQDRAVVKMSREAINLAPVASYAALNLAQGAISLLDGAGRETTVAGTLTLGGDTAIAFDVVPGGSDVLAAASVDLSEVSAEHPVTLYLVQKGGGTFSATGSIPLIAGGLVAGDERKFVVDGLPATLSVENGMLIATLPPDIPYTAVWTGNGDRTNLADPANWNCLNFAGQTLPGLIPTAASAIMVGANTTFCWPAGQSLERRDVIFEKTVTLAGDCDWRGFELPIDFTVNLNGHKLLLSQMNGTGTITDAAPTYQKLEWVTATGSQWINTHYHPKTTTRIVARFNAMARTGDWSEFFGVMSNNSPANAVALRYYSNTGTINGLFCNASYGEATTAVDLQNTDVDVTLQSGSMIVNGTTYTITTVNAPYNSEMRLFCGNNNGTPRRPQAVRLYTFKVYEGTTLVRDFVPAIRTADGVVGVLDVANNDTFYTLEANSTGSLGAGPAVRADVPAAPAGEVHLEVPDGKTVTNSSLHFTGGMKLVKEGSGVFVAALNDQLYVGGTEVVSGTATSALSGSASTTYAASRRLWGANGPITVEAGATFDTLGNYDYTCHRFVLNGGVLTNNGCDMTKGTADKIDANGLLLLITNSTYSVNYNTRHTAGVLDLGGFELTMPIVNAKHFLLDGSSVLSNGQVTVTSGGWFHPMTTPKDMRTVDFTFNCALSLGSDMLVRDLTMLYDADWAEGDGRVLVYGVFTPSATKNYARNFVMQNGSTINLSAQLPNWKLESALSKCNGVTFAEGATVGVKVGGRRLQDGMLLIDWEGKDPPAATFKLLDNQSYLVKSTEEGLRCIANNTIIFVR